jgi:AICAR transformylase/IMP cyclohydrolase PurH
MNQRVLAADRRFIPAQPTRVPEAADDDEPPAESVVFDKAEEAGSLEEMRARLEQLTQQEQAARAAANEADGDERERLERKIEGFERARERLAAVIASREAELRLGENPHEEPSQRSGTPS